MKKYLFFTILFLAFCFEAVASNAGKLLVSEDSFQVARAVKLGRSGVAVEASFGGKNITDPPPPSSSSSSEVCVANHYKTRDGKCLPCGDYKGSKAGALKCESVCYNVKCKRGMPHALPTKCACY